MAEATQAAGQVIARMRGKFRTITFDNGTEFHDYLTLEHHFGATCSSLRTFDLDQYSHVKSKAAPN